MAQHDAYQRIQEKAVKNEAFRQELLHNPKVVLERELNIAFPAGVTVQIHEDSSSELHLVLPPRPKTAGVRSLSDEELAEAAGGMNCVTGHSGCSIASLQGVFCDYPEL